MLVDSNMAEAIFLVASASMPVDSATCLCGTPTNLCAERKLGAHHRHLVPTGGTNSAASALISAVASFLLVILLILFLKAVLSYTLYYAMNWHGRFFRLFLEITLPSTVNRTCPGHDKGCAGTRQGDPTSSGALVQPSLAFPPVAGRRQKICANRSGDDGSDAEDNNRGKRPRLISQEDSKTRVRCPFKVHDPNNREFEQCGTFTNWNRLREHLLKRKHRPRDRCPICGKLFDNDIDWDKHTGVVRKCKPSPKALERPFWVDKYQAAEIEKLSTQGRKNESFEEMYREVCRILFGNETAPDRTASGHPTWFPHFQHTDDLGIDHHRLQEAWNTLKRRTCSLLGMQNVPEDDTMQQLTNYFRAYLEYPVERTNIVQFHEPETEEAAVDEHLGNHEASITNWIPPATPSAGQVPQNSQPEGYAAEGSEGHLEQSLSNLSTYLGQGAEPSTRAVFDPAQAPSVDVNGSDCVNPQALLLQRPDAHQIYLPVSNGITSTVVPSYPTSTAFTLGPAARQMSEPTTLDSSWGQSYKNTSSFDHGRMPGSSVDFDFSVDGHDPVVGSMQPSEGGASEQQSEDRCCCE